MYIYNIMEKQKNNTSHEVLLNDDVLNLSVNVISDMLRSLHLSCEI
ncbi:MAG: hypothetical protein LBT10_01955 [Methanobrevibacter sp.]|nr:hypothetical protein [Methanobrevibacter sp.]